MALDLPNSFCVEAYTANSLGLMLTVLCFASPEQTDERSK